MSISQLQHIKAKFSIFLPVKNGGKYITLAIESILAQQVSDFALIILENKSADNTLSVVQSYSDPRIILIEASEGLEIYDSWRRIFDIIQGGLVTSEFTTIIGHDDILYPQFLKNIEILIATHPEASLYQTQFDLIDKDGNIRRPCKAIPAKECAKDFFLARCWGIRDSFGTGHVFRTSDYIKIGGMPDLPQLLWSDDLLIIRMTKLSYKVCGEQSSFAYRLHDSSASGAVTSKKFVALAEALRCFIGEVERFNPEFLIYENDKTAFGFFIARQINLLNFPFNTKLLGEESSKTIRHVDRKSAHYLPYKLVNRSPGVDIIEQILLKARGFYIAARLIRKNYLN